MAARDLGPDDVVVVIAPDSGRAYLSKYFDDGWLRRLGFLDEPDADVPGPLVGDLPVVAGAGGARVLDGGAGPCGARRDARTGPGDARPAPTARRPRRRSSAP